MPLSPSNRSRRAHAFCLIACPASVALSCAPLACAPSDEAWLRARLTHVAEPTLDALFHADDASFRDFARNAGGASIEQLERSLYATLDATSSERWSTSRRRILPPLRRVVACEGELFGFVGNKGWIARFESLSDEEGMALVRCLERRRESSRNPMEELAAIARELDRLGCADDAARVRLDRARLGSNVAAEAEVLAREALAAAREAGRASLVCEALGDLAALDARRGEIDSLAAHIQEAMTIAVAHRLPQAADLAYFHSGWMQGQGRQGLAAELREAAVRMGREFGAGAREIDFLLMALSIHADYGNWHLVEKDLHRAEPLLSLVQEAEGIPTDGAVQSGVFPGLQARYEETKRSLRVYEGRRLMQTGRIEAAEQEFQTLLDEDHQRTGNGGPNDASGDVALFFHWGRGLLDNGQAERSLAPIRRGIEISKQQQRAALELRFRMLQLEAEVQLSPLEDAETTFRTVFATPMLRRVDAWTELDADLLESRFAFRRGELVLAWSLAGRAYARLQSLAASAEPSTEPHREIEGAARLWEVVRLLAGDEIDSAYGCELVRAEGHAGVVSPNGKGARHAKSSGRAPEDLRVASDRAREQVLRWTQLTGGAHLLYRVGRDHVERWCALRNRVRCDTLALGPDELRDRVAAVIAEMSRDPNDPEAMIDGALSTALSDLGRVLIPEDASMAGAVLVTADGFLRSLPFEALGVAAGDYVPLLEARDVAYLHGTRLLQQRGEQRGLIVSDPLLPDDLRRRYPSLVELGGRESATLAAQHPDAVVLSGQAATKANLLATWRNAGWIYYAGHLIRDAENPFWTFLPLATEPGAVRIQDARLEILDIRNAALSNCRLVVLSGCRSGAPFVTRRNAMPSLADAFVDAGADAVTFTFWDVRDDAVAELTLPLFEEWTAGNSAANALSEARRRLLRTSTGIRHPFGWAVYGLQLGGLE